MIVLHFTANSHNDPFVKNKSTEILFQILFKKNKQRFQKKYIYWLEWTSICMNMFPKTLPKNFVFLLILEIADTVCQITEKLSFHFLRIALSECKFNFNKFTQSDSLKSPEYWEIPVLRILWKIVERIPNFIKFRCNHSSIESKSDSTRSTALKNQ